MSWLQSSTLRRFKRSRRKTSTTFVAGLACRVFSDSSRQPVAVPLAVAQVHVQAAQPAVSVLVEADDT